MRVAAVPEDFEQYRPLLFSIAYRMLGSAMEAEDIVQEAYLRYQSADPQTIRSHKSFLTTIVTRLCLDQLNSARARRETYVGPWLPEPVLTGDNAPWFAPAQRVSEYESISMAFLVLMESLSPLERAVFLLREVFDYDYAEIAAMLNREEAACRQLFSRAKKHVAEHRPRFRSSPQQHQELLERFLQAVEAGELEGLMSLLAEDVTVWSDGGGVVSAATRPVHGPDRVARLMLGIRRHAPPDTTVEIAEINGKAGLIVRAEGRTRFVMTIEVGDGQIHQIRAVSNPNKLEHV